MRGLIGEFMARTPAQRARAQAEAAAYLRDLYAYLGLRKSICERAIQVTRSPRKPLKPRGIKRSKYLPL
jgi:hypothetical protein